MKASYGNIYDREGSVMGLPKERTKGMHRLTVFHFSWFLTVLPFIMLSCMGSRPNVNCSAPYPPETGLTVSNGVAYIGFGSIVAVRTTDGTQMWKTSVSSDTTFATSANGVL